MTETNGAPGPAGINLPMFYSAPEALNPARHSGLSLIARPDFSFAKTGHAVPIVASEMPMAMRSYPVVFVGQQRLPLAVTGIRTGENLFVGSDGRWAEPHYVPAYVRRYPFVLAEDAGTDRLTLCIDRASNRVVESSVAALDAVTEPVTPLFEGSEASQTTKQALDFCEQFQKGIAQTRVLVETIAALNLFADRRSTMKLENGETLNLTDFQIIDEAALNALPDADFIALRRSGALALIYCHLASMNSWSSLVYQAKIKAAN